MSDPFYLRQSLGCVQGQEWGFHTKGLTFI